MSIETVQDPNRAILLAALHPEPDSFARLLLRYGDVLDWNWLLERAIAHKVSALLANRVATAGLEASIPGETRVQLSAASAGALERNTQALHDLEQIDRCLQRASIAYILVKGPVLTQQVYDSPAQRHFFDLDLVVHEADIDPAQAAFEGLGYRLWGGDRYLGFAPTAADDLTRATSVMRTALKRFGHELSLVTEDRSLLPIDVHWHLMPPGRIRAPAAQLWENATSSSVGGVNVRVLDAEATLLHLAMHSWSNRPWSFALLHLCDVAWALRRLPVDPERLAKLAERWGGRDDLDRALYAVEHVLGVRPPRGLQVDAGVLPRSGRFRRMATPDNLLERYARPAPEGWARLKQEIDWGLAIGSLRSTGILLLGKYTALIRYHAGRGG
ncbi:MAG TPA: nucleotidyltransferase family protein [Candidatus Acidoferrales bacterium]|nr:nucleotidyltransferase family protein [Candidatus Acidoferrales bacterium]